MVDAGTDDFQARCHFSYDHPYCYHFTPSNFDIYSYPLPNTISDQDTSSNPDTFCCNCDSDKGYNRTGPHLHAKYYSNKYSYVYFNQP